LNRVLRAATAARTTESSWLMATLWRDGPRSPRPRASPCAGFSRIDHADKDACLTWPFSRFQNGYGLVVKDGASYGAHRYMCELVNGEPPTPEHLAAHSCGKGKDACVNPNHLRWATSQENTLDRYEHGTMLFGDSHPRVKLTAEQVDEIRAIGRSMKQRDLAKLYGVCKSTIGNIVRGEHWAATS
jgi:hypothetical protein